MFGRKKKEKKIEKVFETEGSEQKVEEEQKQNDADIDEELFAEQTPQEETEEEEEVANDRLSTVKEKISKILQSSNIEIIDENEGDEYDVSNEGAAKSQQDYDSLKAIFGSGEKGKKDELTLTIDDFDYTYFGKYVEEYDLLHLKNIKRIKMQRKHSKVTKRLIIAASAIFVVGLAVTLGILLTRQTPVYLKSISLSQTEVNCYMNTSFKDDNIYILAHYSNGVTQRVKLTSEYFYDSTGFVERRPDGSIVFTAGEQATLYFQYSGMQTSLRINIIEKQRNGIKAVPAPEISTLSRNDVIRNENLILLLTYSNTVFKDSGDVVDLSEDVSMSIKLANGSIYNLSYNSDLHGFVVPLDLYGSDVTEGSYLEIGYQGFTTTVMIK